MNALDVARYRETVGHFATGVVVITSRDFDQPVGFTCQTFGSLSLDPILVSFSARSDSNSWPRIKRQGRLAINVLAADQEALARVFAMSAADKFAGVDYVLGENGSPLLIGALAHLEADLLDVHTHGDHDVAVAAVSHVVHAEGSPLIFYRGGFGTFTA